MIEIDLKPDDVLTEGSYRVVEGVVFALAPDHTCMIYAPGEEFNVPANLFLDYRAVFGGKVESLRERATGLATQERLEAYNYYFHHPDLQVRVVALIGLLIAHYGQKHKEGIYIPFCSNYHDYRKLTRVSRETIQNKLIASWKQQQLIRRSYGGLVIKPNFPTLEQALEAAYE